MVKLAIDKSDSRWIKQSQKGPCFKMERHPAYYEKHNKTTGGPDMKMLKKLAALILAATMVLVLFTACGGDTAQSPEAQAENQVMSAINANRPEGKKLENNAQCRAIASQSIDEAANGDLNFSLNLFGYSSKVWFKIDGPKDGKCAATFVTTFDYDTIKAKWAGNVVLSAFPAFSATNLLLVQCSSAVLQCSYGCIRAHPFPLIYAP